MHSKESTDMRATDCNLTLMTRSRVRLEITLSNDGDALEMFECLSAQARAGSLDLKLEGLRGPTQEKVFLRERLRRVFRS